ncbi:MAG: hypothetical protein RIT81_12170 [Deltaproteobacteria bacterium]
MPLALPKVTANPVIPIDEFPLERRDIEWLTKELGERPTLDDVDRFANKFTRKAIDDDEQRRRLSVLTGLQESVRGNFVVRGDKSISAAGKMRLSELQLLALTGARPVNGELDKAVEVKEGMEPFLIGQQHLRQKFADFYASTQAPGRRTAPVMVLAGPDGHGKAQAIEGYAATAHSGFVHRVDLAGLTDRDAPAILGGPLSIDQLRDVAKSGGVVWLQGLEAMNSPKLATGIAALLNMPKLTGNTKLPFFLDFEVKPEDLEDDERGEITRQLAKALDVAGLRTKATQGAIKPLGPDAMLVYAESVLKELMAAEGLEDVHIALDPDARAFLGELLATPHKPLLELEARLRELIVRHLDTQTSVYRKGGFIRIALGKPFQDDPALRERLISRFSEKYVDLFEGHAAFEPLETGRIVDRNDLAEELIETSTKYAHLLRYFGQSLELGEPVQVVDDVVEASHGLAEVLQRVEADLERGAKTRVKKKQGAVSEDLFRELEKAAQTYATSVTQASAEPMLVLPDQLKTSVALRQQLYELVDMYGAGAPIKPQQVPAAGRLAGQFAQAFQAHGDQVAESEPGRRFTNLRVGVEALAAVVDMAAMAANANIEEMQIDIIRRDDAKACREALEQARSILVPYALDNVLRYGPLVDAVHMAGYDERAPVLMKMVDMAKDLLEAMQGEEEESARERSALAVSVLRDFLNETLAPHLEEDKNNDDQG